MSDQPNFRKYWLIPANVRLGDLLHGPTGKRPLEVWADTFEAECEEWMEDIALLATLPDPDTAPCEVLPYLARHVGLDLESCDPCDLQREQIRSVVPWTGLKGTRLGYELFFRALGYEATIIEVVETGPDEGKVIDGSRPPGTFQSSDLCIQLDEIVDGTISSQCGNQGGGLTPDFLKRLKGRIQQITPVHVEAPCLDLGKILIDDVEITDELQVDLELEDEILMGCCCFHGAGAEVLPDTLPDWDGLEWIWDEKRVNCCPSPPFVFWDDIRTVWDDASFVWDRKPAPTPQPLYLWDHGTVWDDIWVWDMKMIIEEDDRLAVHLHFWDNPTHKIRGPNCGHDNATLIYHDGRSGLTHNRLDVFHDYFEILIRHDCCDRGDVLSIEAEMEFADRFPYQEPRHDGLTITDHSGSGGYLHDGVGFFLDDLAIQFYNVNCDEVFCWDDPGFVWDGPGVHWDPVLVPANRWDSTALFWDSTWIWDSMPEGPCVAFFRWDDPAFVWDYVGVVWDDGKLC